MSEDRGYDALRLAELIKPILAGHPPEVQGACLADLLSLWLAGHREDIRLSIFDAHIKGVVALVEIADEQIWGGRDPFDRADH